jgi:FAD/FMN-containing dehydrogenase
LSDDFSRQYFSVDASDFEIKPDAIVRPRDSDDLSAICKYCAENNQNLTARGAGTGLVGQCLGSGIIVDFTSHMNRILEVSEDTVTVQPGVVKALLDERLRRFNKYLPPDPASNTYCTVGGMVANNSSGIHSLRHGSTIDFVEKVKLVYADGTTGFAGKIDWDDRMEKLRQLLEPNRDWILNKFPKVNKNSCGYRLDAVLKDGFRPQKLFAASEGTLGLLTEISFLVKDLPEYSCLVVLGFKDILTAASIVPKILRFNPSAAEILDHTATDLETSAGKGCLLFVEVSGNASKKVEDDMRKCVIAASDLSSVISESSDRMGISRIWQARKAALNNTIKMTIGSRKPIGLIEDTVVSPTNLRRHISQILSLYRRHHFKYAMYGHAGNGNIHTRPLANFDSLAELNAIKEMAMTLFANVVRSGGTITGEHGDGLARVRYIEAVYGCDMTSLFRRVKELFDPAYLLNPGKKVPTLQKK